MSELTTDHQELIEAARAVIRLRFKEGSHHVAAALRTTAGAVFSAVNLEATVGRIAVCAEAVAIGMAASAGDSDIETIVSVNRNGQVISPCGMCRELVTDFSPDAVAIVPASGDGDSEAAVPLGVLLPNKYRKLH